MLGDADLVALTDTLGVPDSDTEGVALSVTDADNDGDADII
jgi:hypothetical protein